MMRPWIIMALLAVLTLAAVLVPGGAVTVVASAKATSAVSPTTATSRPLTREANGSPRAVLNPSGLQATVVDRAVLLFEDGSWSIEGEEGESEALAVTHDGRHVALNSAVDVETGERNRSWHFVNDRTGMLQVVISRAISARGLGEPYEWSCLPQITVRNLTNLDVYRIIVELQISSGDKPPFNTSVLFNTLQYGDAMESNMQPLVGANCQGLTATLHVPYCEFTNGLDCSAAVQASAFGFIPLHYMQESP